MSFYVVIPARLASTRLPDKPLADIHGKPMIVRVAEQAKCSGACDVIVATDDSSIVDACANFGIRALMTRKDHVSGTDRIAEVASKMDWASSDTVVNVQGDEPLIDPELIAACCDDVLHIEGGTVWDSYPIDVDGRIKLKTFFTEGGEFK